MVLTLFWVQVRIGCIRVGCWVCDTSDSPRDETEGIEELERLVWVGEEDKVGIGSVGGVDNSSVCGIDKGRKRKQDWKREELELEKKWCLRRKRHLHGRWHP